MSAQPNNGRSRPRFGTVVIVLAGVLLCLVLISTHLMGGLYARYISRGDGDDTARVAKFAVDITGSDDVTAVYDETESGEYTITVTNNSEVAVRYTIEVNLPEDLDFGVTAQLDVDPVPLAPGGEQVHQLTFAPDWSEFTENETGLEREETLAFTVTVDVEQID